MLLLGEAIVEVARAFARIWFSRSRKRHSPSHRSRRCVPAGCARRSGSSKIVVDHLLARDGPSLRLVLRHPAWAFLEDLRAAGAAHPAYLPMGCDAVAHAPVTLSDGDRARFTSDVSFAGSPYTQPPARVHEPDGLRFQAVGDGWQHTPLARHAAGGGVRLGDDEFRIAAATRIDVNLHSARIRLASIPRRTTSIRGPSSLRQATPFSSWMQEILSASSLNRTKSSTSAM